MSKRDQTRKNLHRMLRRVRAPLVRFPRGTLAPPFGAGRIGEPFLALHRSVRRAVILRRMSWYVRGEMPPDAKREAGRWIDRDDAVYTEYMRTKRDDDALSADLSGIGRPQRPQLDRAWANIGASLNGRAPLYRLAVSHFADWRFSVAVAAIIVALIVPMALGVNRVAAIGIATQPQPPTAIVDVLTPTGENADSELPDSRTPQLMTAQYVARATPTAPETE